MFFFLPTGSTSETSRRPWVTIVIAALCVAVFAWTGVLEPERSPDFSEARAFVEERPWLAGDDYQGPVPERAVLEADRQEFKALIARAIDRGGSTERKLSLVPAHGYVQIGWITNLFLHFSLGHLLGNLLFLWVVGPLLEEAWGRRRFLVFYLAAGLVLGGIVPENGRGALFVDLVMKVSSGPPTALRLSGTDAGVALLFPGKSVPEAWRGFIESARRAAGVQQGAAPWAEFPSLEALTLSWVPPSPPQGRGSG